MRNLYLECTSGISGDMTVSALIDAGADKAALLNILKNLDLDGYDVVVSKCNKSNIQATMFEVNLHTAHHHHEDEHHHHHGHRTLKDIAPIIESAGLTLSAKRIAHAIFKVLAEAEGAVHGLPPEDVHFHEVGAVDSIIDIIAIAFCIDNLNLDKVLCSQIHDGKGQVKTQHGIMPVPVPATVELIKRAGLSLVLTDTEGEMVTPTGAAVLAALADNEQEPKMGKIYAIGIGAGKKDFAHANILRAFIYENDEKNDDTVYELTTNLDDITGEQMGYLLDTLINRGALDALYAPVFMKKNRPAYQLQVLTDLDHKDDMIKTILKHSSAIGLRVNKISRKIMQRKQCNIDTKYGKINLKVSTYDDIEKYSIEYDSAKQAALTHNVSIDEVYKAAIAAQQN